jgi:hypothetical protein
MNLIDSFIPYFQSGIHHIADIQAYDHLLFVMTLCASFQLNEWRKIIVIITAFTLGHSITLVLTAFSLIPENPRLIEILIPFTIMISAISNVWNDRASNQSNRMTWKYIIACLFGLIHGLAFASNFKMMIFENQSLILPLFAFNIGIEIGQLMVVGLFLIMLFVFTQVFRTKHQSWNTFISGAGFGIASTLLINALMK